MFHAEITPEPNSCHLQNSGCSDHYNYFIIITMVIYWLLDWRKKMQQKSFKKWNFSKTNAIYIQQVFQAFQNKLPFDYINVFYNQLLLYV